MLLHLHVRLYSMCLNCGRTTQTSDTYSTYTSGSAAVHRTRQGGGTSVALTPDPGAGQLLMRMHKSAEKRPGTDQHNQCGFYASHTDSCTQASRYMHAHVPHLPRTLQLTSTSILFAHITSHNPPRAQTHHEHKKESPQTGVNSYTWPAVPTTTHLSHQATPECPQ